MRKLKFVPFLLAGLMAVTPVFAATVTAPLDTGITTTTENFSNLTKTLENKNTNQFVESFSSDNSIYLKTGWVGANSNLVYAGADDANKIDTLKSENDKAFRLSVAPETGGAVVVSVVQNQNLKLQEGDVYTFSFDLAVTDPTAAHRIAVYMTANNSEVDAIDVLDGSDFISNKIATSTPWNTGVEQGITTTFYDFYLNPTGNNSKYICFGGKDDMYSGSYNPVAKTFKNYKFVIDTKDETMDGKQTIAWYVDGVRAGNNKALFGLVKSDGTISNEPLNGVGKICIKDEIFSSANELWLDNLTYSVQKETEDVYEDYSDVKYSNDKTEWTQVDIGKTNVIANGSGRTYFAVTDDADNFIGKTGGDKYLKVSYVNKAPGVTVENKPNITVNKGDIVTCSFNYKGTSDTDTNKSQVIKVFMNSGNFTFDSLTGNDSQKVKRTSGDLLKLFANGATYIYNGGEYYCSSLLNNGAMDRFDFVLNTADSEADDKQTMAIYINGNLVEKGILYEQGKTEPISKIESFKMLVENSSGDGTVYFDNIWISKTANALEATKINGKINVTYSYPPVYETGVKSSIIAAYFGADDVLLGTKIVPLTTDETSRTLKADFEPVDGTLKTKLFIWNDVNDIVPVAPALEVR